ncbi:MAG: RNA 2',3'-cyclic phosphodiesterase [Acidobacteria bacterium]|nr:RNA 2',3'-cyclic phosphodiesterase [Acidobacteriota bacterium]MBI3473635.1 RNA 2',3'-cyclic phosphodiesterase [Candidatus Solibacter usitatus]
MRLFTAIDLPKDLLASLDALVQRLKHTARIGWSPVANLHLTTKFIGEWEEARLEELKKALGQLPKREPIAVRVRGLGFFPNARSPRVFWAGVEAPRELVTLAGQTDLALSGLGITIEGRAYTPHLTLARIKDTLPLDSLHQAIAQLPSQELGGFTADRFYLYQSRPSPSGSVYTRLAEFPF